MTNEQCPACDGWNCDNECVPYWRAVNETLRVERDQAVDRAEKMHLLGLRLGRELADLERENASLRRRLREGGR